MKEKQYRIIRPEKGLTIGNLDVGEWEFNVGVKGSSEQGILYAGYTRRTNSWPEIKDIALGKLGDIVPFSQLEEWKRKGLEPECFTEEVK